MPKPCPICGATPAPDTPARLRPFCSQRCADVDLGRWFTGQYRVPARPDDEEDVEGEAVT